MLTIYCLDEPIELHAEKALYRPRCKTLIIADPHFGKAATFRSAGIPIPQGTTAADLARLSGLLLQTGAERLVVLGDFFHAKSGRAPGTMATIAAWRAGQSQLDVTIVRGNHDRRAGDPPAEWNVRCAPPPLEADSLVYAHEPLEHEAGYVLAGHIHPAITLHDACGPSLKSACFWFGPRTAVLPAFGSFTGVHRVHPAPGDRVFAVGPGQVIEIPNRRARSAAKR